MPRSPTRTSIGSPGTSRISMKLMRVTATKVGMMMAIRRSKKRSMVAYHSAAVRLMGFQLRTCVLTFAEHDGKINDPRKDTTARNLLQLYLIELMTVERAHLIAGDLLAHRHEHH